MQQMLCLMYAPLNQGRCLLGLPLQQWELNHLQLCTIRGAFCIPVNAIVGEAAPKVTESQQSWENWMVDGPCL